MNKSKPWHEDDAFWETWHPLIFSSRHMENAAGEVDKIIHLLEITPRAHILDFGCGIGRHSLELARRNYQVTGVDRTLSYLEEAKNRAKREKLTVKFIREDMRTFQRPDTFDAVINMFTTFGYFEDDEDDRQIIVNIYDSLKSGGALIIDTHGKESFARIFQERIWTEINGIIWLQEQVVSDLWSWVQSHWIMLRGNERIEAKISFRLYSGTEISALLTGCGFSQVDIYGDLSGNPYDHTAKRMVVVGRK